MKNQKAGSRDSILGFLKQALRFVSEAGPVPAFVDTMAGKLRYVLLWLFYIYFLIFSLRMASPLD